MRIAWSKNYDNLDIKLLGRGLKAHTAIIAQSGSGKSYTLGRMIEEICLKTRAKVCVLDPNADFINFHRINRDIWKKDEFKDYLDDELITHFDRKWKNLKFRILTQRDKKFIIKTKNLTNTKIFIKWNDLSDVEQLVAMELEIDTNPAYLLLCSYVRIKSIEIAKKHRLRDLVTYETELRKVIFELSKPRRPERDIDLPEIIHKVCTVKNAIHVYNHFDKNILTKPYYRGHHEKTLSNVIRDFYDSDENFISVDLPSIKDEEDRITICSYVLDSLWERATKQWDLSLINKKINETRFPVFIVIDEAHNLIPEEANSKIKNDLLQKFQRIATEGRKYGLFLIVVSQRPTRINKTVISQCDSLILQRMTNRSDIELIDKNFSFIPEGWSKKAMKFDVGDAILCGSFVNLEEIAKIAPRRTHEGGSNLNDKYWLKE